MPKSPEMANGRLICPGERENAAAFQADGIVPGFTHPTSPPRSLYFGGSMEYCRASASNEAPWCARVKRVSALDSSFTRISCTWTQGPARANNIGCEV